MSGSAIGLINRFAHIVNSNSLDYPVSLTSADRLTEAHKEKALADRLVVPADEQPQIQELLSSSQKLPFFIGQERYGDDGFRSHIEIQAEDQYLDRIGPALDQEKRIFDLNGTAFILKGKKEKDNAGQPRVVTVLKPSPTASERVTYLNTPRHTNLLRPLISYKMQQVIQEYQLDLLGVVKDLFMPCKASLARVNPNEELLILSRKAPVFNGGETGLLFLSLPEEIQIKLVTQLCIFIQHTALADAHFGNFQFAMNDHPNLDALKAKLVSAQESGAPRIELTEDDLACIGNLTIVDTELHGLDEQTPMGCAKLGLIRLRQCLAETFTYDNPFYSPENWNNIPKDIDGIIGMSLYECSEPDTRYFKTAQEATDQYISRIATTNEQLANHFSRPSIGKKSVSDSSIDKAMEKAARREQKSSWKKLFGGGSKKSKAAASSSSDSDISPSPSSSRQRSASNSSSSSSSGDESSFTEASSSTSSSRNPSPEPTTSD